MNHKIIMDTNVAVKAATPQQDCKEEEWEMRKICIDFIQNLTRNPESKLVLDLDYEIIKEYRNRIPKDTNEGLIFWRWFDTYIGWIEAADGKWLGFKEVFEEYGVHIEFLDMDYAAMMYNRKVADKRRS